MLIATWALALRSWRHFLSASRPSWLSKVSANSRNATRVPLISVWLPGQFAEQRQIIPDRLQVLQCTAIFFGGGDVRDDALQITIQIDAFEFAGHEEGD